MYKGALKDIEEVQAQSLVRIATALELAILEKRYKHVYRDIDELHRSIDELERLTHGDSNENTEY